MNVTYYAYLYLQLDRKNFYSLGKFISYNIFTRGIKYVNKIKEHKSSPSPTEMNENKRRDTKVQNNVISNQETVTKWEKLHCSK